ncbi:MAG TPA: hypothetical protein GXX37_07225 [Clostridiaceae bacterium]|nr:hypothetical protein [Clostridiaceae bacterium]
MDENRQYRDGKINEYRAEEINEIKELDQQKELNQLNELSQLKGLNKPNILYKTVEANDNPIILRNMNLLVPEGRIYANEHEYKQFFRGYFFFSTSDLGQSWKMYTDLDGDRVLENEAPMEAFIITGELLWRDYDLTLDVRQLTPYGDIDAETKDTCVSRNGLVFGYYHRRDYYLFCLEGYDRIVLYRKKGNAFYVVYEKKEPFSHKLFHKLSVCIKDGRIQCYMNNKKICEVIERNFHGGKVGIFSNSLCDFRNFKVFMPGDSYDIYIRKKSSIIKSHGFFQDTIKGYKYNFYSEYKYNFDSDCNAKSTRESNLHITADEFYIGIQGNKIIKAELGTNNIILQAELPRSGPFIGKRNAQVLPGGLYYYKDDLNKNDMVILRDGTDENGYSMWAYNTDLELLWKASVNMPGTGRKITFYDINQDGEKEIIAGYDCFNNKGELLWSMPEGIYLDEPSCGAILVSDEQGKDMLLMGVQCKNFLLAKRICKYFAKTGEI